MLKLGEYVRIRLVMNRGFCDRKIVRSDPGKHDFPTGPTL